MYHIGIDPGKSGAIVAINSEDLSIRSIRFSKATDHDVVDFLKEIIVQKGQHKAVLEQVSSSPQMGVVSSFSFGQAYGKIQGILAALGVPYETITPRSWQKEIGIPAKKKTESQTTHKNKLKEQAQRLFPNEYIVKENADAYLLAIYCSRNKGLL